MNAHQIMSNSTDGANRKKFGGDSVVWSWCGALKGMILGFECGFVGSTYRANETQHRNRMDLEIHIRPTRLLVEVLIFITQCTNFFWVQSKGEGNHQGQSLFQHILRVDQSASHGIPRNSPRSMFLKKYALRCHTGPNSIYVNSN